MKANKYNQTMLKREILKNCHKSKIDYKKLYSIKERKQENE